MLKLVFYFIRYKVSHVILMIRLENDAGLCYTVIMSLNVSTACVTIKQSLLLLRSTAHIMGRKLNCETVFDRNFDSIRHDLFLYCASEKNEQNKTNQRLLFASRCLFFLSLIVSSLSGLHQQSFRFV